MGRNIQVQPRNDCEADCHCEVVPPDCGLFSDTFDRADDTDLGADWTEAAGSWSISSNTLVTTSGSARCICNTAHSSPNLKVNCTVRATVAGTLVRLIANYVDANNYWFAQIQIGGTSPQLRVYRRAGGTETQIAFVAITLETATNTDYPFTFCCTEGKNLYATFGTVSIGGFNATAPTSGSFGVGTSTNTGTVTFENFEALKVELGCEFCQTGCDCVDFCDTGTAAARYLIVFSGFTCTNLNTSVYVDSGACCFWSKSFNPGFTSTCGGSGFWMVELSFEESNQFLILRKIQDGPTDDAPQFRFDMNDFIGDCSTIDGLEIDVTASLNLPGSCCSGSSPKATIYTA